MGAYLAVQALERELAGCSAQLTESKETQMGEELKVRQRASLRGLALCVGACSLSLGGALSLGACALSL
jgi:hypothetical protein